MRERDREREAATTTTTQSERAREEVREICVWKVPVSRCTCPAGLARRGEEWRAGAGQGFSGEERDAHTPERNLGEHSGSKEVNSTGAYFIE